MYKKQNYVGWDFYDTVAELVGMVVELDPKLDLVVELDLVVVLNPKLDLVVEQDPKLDLVVKLDQKRVFSCSDGSCSRSLRSGILR